MIVKIPLNKLRYKNSYCLVSFTNQTDLRCEVPKMSAKSFRNYISHHKKYEHLEVSEVTYRLRTGTFFKITDCWV